MGYLYRKRDIQKYFSERDKYNDACKTGLGICKGNQKEDNMKESELGKIYYDGDIICHEGEEGKGMFVIQSGKVKIVKKRPEGELVLGTMTKGEIFGEITLFDHMPRSVTVKAVGKSVVLTIDKKGFFAKASKDPTLVFNILEGMSRRIRDLNHELSKYKKNEGDI